MLVSYQWLHLTPSAELQHTDTFPGGIVVQETIITKQYVTIKGYRAIDLVDT